MKVLIIGGTFEAVEIARILDAKGYRVITSLAGRTNEPTKPVGKLISGGLGGVQGIIDFVRKNKIQHLIDASHPFAQNISHNIVQAASALDLELIRFVRPEFVEPRNANWLRVQSNEEAAQIVPSAAKVFLSVGRQNLEPFVARPDLSYVVRSIEKPDMLLPENFKFIQQRPPFTRDDELSLLRGERVSHLVAKNSGGQMTSAKIEAAHMLSIQVVMIERPKLREAPSASSIDQLIAHFDQFPPAKRRFFFFP